MAGEFRIENHELKAYTGSDKNIAVPEGVRKIAYGAFSGKESLESVALPGSLEIVGLCAFSDCVNLSSINFPRNLVCIMNSAFENCISLGTIKFPAALEYIGSSAFESCENLEDVFFEENESDDGGVLVIGNSAFNGCMKLSSMNVPLRTKIIGAYAFYGCGFSDDGRMKVPCGMNAEELRGGRMYEPERNGSFLTYGRDLMFGPGTYSFSLSGSCRGFDGYNIDEVTSDELKLALGDDGGDMIECVDWNGASLRIRNLGTREEHIFYVNSDMHEPLFYGDGKFYSVGIRTVVHDSCLIRQTGNDNAEVCYGEVKMEKKFALSDFVIDFHYYSAAGEGIFSAFRVRGCPDVLEVMDFSGNAEGWIFNGTFEAGKSDVIRAIKIFRGEPEDDGGSDNTGSAFMADGSAD